MKSIQQQLTPNKAIAIGGSPRKEKRLGAYKTALLLTAILLCNIPTYAQQWQWAQTYSGRTPYEYNGHENYILRSHLDEQGNIYMVARFGAGATRNRNPFSYLDEARDPVNHPRWRAGIMVAKMGADGEFIWQKMLINNTNYSAGIFIRPVWAEFKEDAIYVLVDYESIVAYPIYPTYFLGDTLHFFGEEACRAEILAATKPPFEQGGWTALVKFSYDGEVLEKHFIRYQGSSSIWSDMFHVDNSGNTYIYGFYARAGEQYVCNLDGEETYNFVGQGISIIKLNSNWRVEWIKPMYHSVVDNLNNTVSNLRNNFRGLSFDEDDNMYLTGQINFGVLDFNENQFPIYFNLDEEHKIVVNGGELGYADDTGYVIKYDTVGNVLWCNQLYSRYISASCSMYFEGSTVSDNEVFVLGNGSTVQQYEIIYFKKGDEEIEVISSIPSQMAAIFVVKFDKETGQYIEHDIIPNEFISMLNGMGYDLNEPAIKDNHIIVNASINTPDLYYNNYRDIVIAKFSIDSCKFAGVMDTIYFSNSYSYKSSGSVVANNSGDMFINFVSNANTMRLGNLPPKTIGTDEAVFAYYSRNRVTGITLNKDAITLKIDSTEQLVATVLPTDATNQNIFWQSSTPAVASVVDGLVTALTAGTATITVTTEDGNHTAECEVTVEKGSGIDDDVLANSISIHLNPAGQLKIESGAGINSVEIYDVTGKTLLATHYSLLDTHYLILDTNSLPHGVYLVKIYTNKGIKVERIIKN